MQLGMVESSVVDVRRCDRAYRTTVNYLVALSQKGCQLSSFPGQKLDITVHFVGASPSHAHRGCVPAPRWGLPSPKPSKP